MTALYIKWVDAQTWTNAWLDGNELSELALPIYEVRGTVVKETPEAIFLAQCTGESEHRNIFGIPKGSILKRKKIP